jgi:hypothetical protein
MTTNINSPQGYKFIVNLWIQERPMIKSKAIAIAGRGQVMEEHESCAGKGRARLSEAAKKCFLAGRLISAAEAGVEDLPVIAALR